MFFIQMKKFVASNCFFILYMFLVGMCVCVFVCVCIIGIHTHMLLLYMGVCICVYVYIYRQTERQREMSERQKAGEIEKDLHLDIVKQLSNSCKHQTKITAVSDICFLLLLSTFSYINEDRYLYLCMVEQISFQKIEPINLKYFSIFIF